jgi:hypothetical protein
MHTLLTEMQERRPLPGGGPSVGATGPAGLDTAAAPHGTGH